MKTASRPNSAATTPPSVAPMARLNDHVVEESVFAAISVSGVVMLGITALRAGSKNAAIMVSSSSSGQTSQTSAGVRTNSMPSTMAARARSAAIMTRLRLTRSLTTPAVGPTSVCGSTWSTTASATAAALPVSSSSRL